MSSKSQPHATTSDQIAEMESEGQAAKPGTSAQASPPTHTESPRADSMEGAPGRPMDPEPDHPQSDQDIDTAGTEADESSPTSRQVRREPAGEEQTDDVEGDVAWQEGTAGRRRE
jgi:hypothetical protein